MDASKAELPIGYYLDNFLYLLDFVTDRYADLLVATERDFVRGFGQFSLSAQRLYVRLALRKGPIFRSDKVEYSEIPAVIAAVEELTLGGFLDAGDDEDLTCLLGLLVKPELVRLRPQFEGLSRKALLVEIAASISSEEFFNFIDFAVYRPRRLEVLKVFRLLFFGNLRQDFTEFVLNDLGIMPYENYDIDGMSRFFDRRQKIEQALVLDDLAEQADARISANDRQWLRSYRRLLPVDLDPGLQRRLDKINNRVARQLERLNDHEAALALYAETCSGAARERSVRMLATHLGRVDVAIDLCQQIIESPEHEAEFEFGCQFAERLARNKADALWQALPVLPKLDYPIQQLNLERRVSERVELAVVRHFESAGDRAYYVENSLFTAIFGLVFWDVIFAPVKGAFFNPFQRGPADLFTPAFRIARADALKLRLQELSSIKDLRTRVLAVAEQKAGITNPFVNWGHINLQLFEACFERVPLRHFHEIFERILRDPRANRSGFPDLIVFPLVGDYFLAEVKGPNDKLQANQIRWLRYFSSAQIPHRLVNVEWQ